MKRLSKNKKSKSGEQKDLPIHPVADNLISNLSEDGWEIVSFHRVSDDNAGK